MIGGKENEETYPWGHARRFNDYAAFIKRKFGIRLQKLSVNAGFTCPNRDGTKDAKGCAYCNNNTFKPGYCVPDKTIAEQIDKGAAFFTEKYPEMRFLAYFQSYSNTYGSIDLLEKVYYEALSHDSVDGLVIGTRPDCVNNRVLDLISRIAEKYFVAIEYGIESTLDKTLLRINRRHTFKETQEAVVESKARNIHVGGHLILGLPGESREELLGHAVRLSDLSLDTLKLHQLQIVKQTTFAKEYQKQPREFNLFSPKEYIELAVDFLELLSPEVVIERFVSQSPVDQLIAPKWGLKNFEMTAKIEKRLKERNTRQGRLFQTTQAM